MKHFGFSLSKRKRKEQYICYLEGQKRTASKDRSVSEVMCSTESKGMYLVLNMHEFKLRLFHV